MTAKPMTKTTDQYIAEAEALADETGRDAVELVIESLERDFKRPMPPELHSWLRVGVHHDLHGDLDEIDPAKLVEGFAALAKMFGVTRH